MKKIILILSSIILGILAVITITNDANADSMRIVHNYAPNFYFAQLNSSGTRVRSGQLMLFNTSNNRMAYCIAPSEDFTDGSFEIHNYNESNILDIINNTQNKDMNKLTQEQLERIKLLAYYGYGYGNHNTIKYKVATQMLIWRVADPTRTFTDKNCFLDKSCKNITDAQAGLANEIAEINRLVDNHLINPSFSGDVVNLELGKTITLNDTNNVLSNFKIASCTNCNATITNNTLSITATSVGDYSIRLETKMDNYTEPMLFGIDETNQNQVVAGFIDPAIARVRGKVSGGSVTVIKKDDKTGIKLNGAKFEVYDSSNLKVCDVNINNGEGVCNGLSLGNYTLKEVIAPIGYVILKNPITFTINENNPNITLEVENELIKTFVEINKADSETGNMPQGSATLKNAKYGVYETNTGDLITTLVTDSNGYAKSEKVLEYGKSYYLQEIEASNGYKIDNTRYDLGTISSAEVIRKDVKEEVIKNHINILKQYDFVDGNTTILHPEKNISFEIYYENGNLFDTIKTDDNGYASIDIPFGIWRFHQVNTSAGFSKINDFYVIVDKDTKETQYYYILNNKLNAYLKVIKIDSETKKVIKLANTTFKIFNIDTNSYVSQYVAGKVLDEFKTDENGMLTTYLKLEAGNYKLMEIKAPDGYLINKDGLEFSIGDDTKYFYSEYGATIVVEYENTPIKGVIEINKNGEVLKLENNEFKYEIKPLKGVTFEVYAREDIMSSDKTYLYYHKGDLVDTIVTDSKGYAKTKELPLGKYYIVESKTVKDYVLDNEQHDLELNAIDNKTSVVYKSISKLNYLKKGTLEFTKTDLTTGKAIPNTIIELYNINAETNEETLIFTGKTDKDGKITIKNLFSGKFYIKEKEAATGYLLTEEKIIFEIKDNGEIVKANMTNELIKGKLIFYKTDEDGNTLAGVSINIYREDNTLVGTYVTDENGMIVVDDLEFGNYYIREKATLKDYKISDETIKFSISENEEVINVSMVNAKLPQTGLNSYMKISAIAIMTLGVIIIAFNSKKNKNKGE